MVWSRFSKTSQAGIAQVSMALAVAALLGSIVTGCNSTKFVGAAPNKQAAGNDKDKNGGGPGSALPGADGNFATPPTFNMAQPLATSVSESAAWVVNSSGDGYRILLDETKQYPMTKFTGLSGGGHRTFVSKYGLFIGVTADQPDGGKVYFVPNSVKEGDSAQLAVDLKAAPFSISGSSRVCVIVFSVSDKDYLGVAYTQASGANNVRKFYRAPIDSSKPGHVDTANHRLMTVPQVGGANDEWGYSCTYDPRRNYFYSKKNSYGGSAAGGGTVGIDLVSGNGNDATMTIVSSPNKAHTMTGPGAAFSYNLSSAGGSYAIAASVNGDILLGNGSVIYTMAHEPISDTVIVSRYDGSAMYGLNGKCFTEMANCPGGANDTNAVTYNPAGVPGIGPLSSMNDGRVLGLHRGSTSNLFMMSLNDPKDRSKGLKVTKIKDIPGDAYMYTDFTGAMISAKETIATFDLTQASGFKPGKPIGLPRLKWKELTGTPATWTGLTVAVACRAKGATNVEPQTVDPMPDAGIDVDLSKISGCTGVYDEVVVVVKPLTVGALVFSKTSEFVFAGLQ